MEQVYDPVTGQYTDAATANSDWTGTPAVIDVSSGGDSSGGGFLSSFGSILPGLTSSVTSIYKSLNPPKPVTVSPGQVVYNPQTGTYQPAVTYPSGVSSISPMFLLILVAVIAIVVLRR